MLCYLVLVCGTHVVACSMKLGGLTDSVVPLYLPKGEQVTAVQQVCRFGSLKTVVPQTQYYQEGGQPSKGM